MQDEIDKLYKKLDEQRIWYLDQIADIKSELDNVNTAWVNERKKIIKALEFIEIEMLGSVNKLYYGHEEDITMRSIEIDLDIIKRILRGDKRC